MIKINLTGGLGNQLFQIFSLIDYSIRHELDYRLPSKLSSGCRNKTYWDNIFKNIKDKIDDKIVLKKKYNEKYYHFVDIPKMDNIMLNGYFQSWRYFKDNYEQIYNLLDMDELKKKYYVKNACSMHFRLGDYKQKPKFHNILSLEYYDNALKYLVEKTKNNWDILYFCEQEDIGLVKLRIDELKLKYKNLNFIYISNEKDDWEQLLIMSNCSHNIIANSTFSWWGAYLNSNKEKLVICPDIWFGPKIRKNKIVDLFYKNCVRIKLK